MIPFPMPSMFDDVKEFHNKVLGVAPEGLPSLVSTEYVMERMRFLLEEVTEFGDAAMTADMVGTADALADIIYVALGTAYMMGLPFQEIWDHVHRANMQKVKGVTKRGNDIDAVKPEGWIAPEAGIAALLLRRIDNE
jgi:predicted HAD superfamily Cof-like phosphohydrolase